MGLVLDIVPNHMGIGADNPYWDDLLAHGPSRGTRAGSTWSGAPTTQRLANKVLLPVLGDSLDAVLERGELALEVAEYGRAGALLRPQLPARSGDAIRRSSSSRCATRRALPAAREWSAGEEGRARLRALLERQHYVLDFWRTASRDINYRRFFDVNELIALKVEDAEVFEATHRTVLQFVADGLVDGLRIDHIDGLLRAAALPRAAARGGGRAPAAGGRGALLRSSSRRSSRLARRCRRTGRWTARRATSS